MYFFWFDLRVIFFVVVLFLIYVIKDNVLLQIIISVLISSLILSFIMASVGRFLVRILVLLIYAGGLLLFLIYVSSILRTVEVYKSYLLNFVLVGVLCFLSNMNIINMVVNKSITLFSLYSDQYFFVLVCGGLLCRTLYLSLLLLI